MNSRERVLTALDHREPDRVPIDFWATSEIKTGLLEHFGLPDEEALLQKLEVDFRYIEGPRYIGPEPARYPDGSVEDFWGVPRVKVEIAGGRAAYSELKCSPLERAASIEEIRDDAKWPDPDWFDYECVGEQVEAARLADKVVIFAGDRMNRCAQLKPAMYLRGIQRIMEDMILAPELAEYILRRIANFYLEYARRTFAAAGDGLDIFMTGDDFGTQIGPMMSLEMWRRFLRPGFEAFLKLGKSHGYRTMHHSCGSILPLIPDMIECGLDILNPIQPEVRDMEPAELKRRFGDRLSFHGSISIQRNLPFGSAGDIRREVRERFEALGPGGGFIFCSAHNIQVDTSLENVEALFEAYRELGRYV